jgi:hypothetical protein
MDLRQLAGIALLLLAMGGGLYVLLREGDPAQAQDAALPAQAKLIVYYLDQGKDCATCEQIPAYARETLETHFAEALAAQTILWRAVDVDLPANAHLVEKYGLYTKSIVLVRARDGQEADWKNLDRVWDLVYDKPAFVAYLREEIDALLAQDAA